MVMAAVATSVMQGLTQLAWIFLFTARIVMFFFGYLAMNNDDACPVRVVRASTWTLVYTVVFAINLVAFHLHQWHPLSTTSSPRLLFLSHLATVLFLQSWYPVGVFEMAVPEVDRCVFPSAMTRLTLSLTLTVDYLMLPVYSLCSCLIWRRAS